MYRRLVHARAVIVTIALLTLSPREGVAQGGSLDRWQRLARDIFEQLIEINTTHSTGSTTDAARAMALRLREAGIPERDIHVLGPHPDKGNLVVRIPGTGRRPPLLLLAHLDVVEALPEDWSFDPFTFRELDAFFYGRGTTDDKAMAAIWIANLIRLAEEGFTPDRDIIVALTADEEGGPHNGVQWLLANHRDLIDAEYALNEGGGGQLKNGERLLNEVQASEKVYLSFSLEVHNPGGHSSRPTKENAIYRLARGLDRLAAYEFPVVLNEITRAFFERMSRIEAGQGAADMLAATGTPPDAQAVARLSRSPYYNALLRTTCVATQVQAGHAENALPQSARATVNCRILPGESPEGVQQTLTRVLADDSIAVRPIGEATPSPPSPLTPEVLGGSSGSPGSCGRARPSSPRWSRAPRTACISGTPASPRTACPDCSTTSMTCGRTDRTSASASASSSRDKPSCIAW